MTNQDLYNHFMNNPHIKPQWGQELFRDIFIPELLGTNDHSILYWAGKRMAREFPIMNIEDLITFFSQSSFGELSIKHPDRSPLIFKLGGPLVQQRINELGEDADFMFEAGFLAQTIEHQRGITSEAEMDPRKNKHGIVTITVHTDPDQPAVDLANQPEINIIHDKPIDDEKPNQK